MKFKALRDRGRTKGSLIPVCAGWRFAASKRTPAGNLDRLDPNQANPPLDLPADAKICPSGLRYLYAGCAARARRRIDFDAGGPLSNSRHFLHIGAFAPVGVAFINASKKARALSINCSALKPALPMPA